MKKVVGNYFNLIPLYEEATIGVWNLTIKVMFWARRILKKPKLNLEFHFVKNGNQDSVKKMPL
jgi:hypothetical protein